MALNFAFNRCMLVSALHSVFFYFSLRICFQDNGGKFKIPSKLLPHSELTTSLSLLPSDTQGSVSDWEESGESIDFQKWDEPVADEDDKSSGNLSGEGICGTRYIYYSGNYVYAAVVSLSKSC